jgi:polyisoprenyl-teichoic acid--peptidoglycan teichoic acid transferase
MNYKITFIYTRRWKMKIRKKVFFRNIIILVLLIAVGAFSYFYYYLNSLTVVGGAEGYPVPGKRVNVLVIGVANGLADTMMLASFNPGDKDVQIYSIPRDTYYERKGSNGTAQHKINASYGKGKAEGVVKSVEGLTGVPIHYYVQIDYNAVKSIVNAVGGIKVTVPQNMNYDDPADDLHIHFEKGQVISDGGDIVKILRYRKNNKGGGYNEGDLGRIKMQQEVVKLGMEKVIKGNLVLNFMKLQGPIQDNVKTNMTPKQMMFYITKASGVKSDNINLQTLPGTTKNINGLSFFVVNKEKMRDMLTDLLDGK